VNVAARHPELVDRCIAFSGLFDVHRLLDGDPFWNDLCYYHSPEAFIPNMDEACGRAACARRTG
jgi:esterase/lipase superfamily enzyme